MCDYPVPGAGGMGGRKQQAAAAALPLTAVFPSQALFQCEEAESDLGAVGGGQH